jgi:hypothetical protein
MTGTPAADFLRLTAGLSLPSARYWGVLFETNSAAAEAGEIFMGSPITLPPPQFAGGISRPRKRYVTRDESPAGDAWKVKRGEPRRHRIYGWNAMDPPDWANYQALDVETAEGLKNIAFIDNDGAIWMAELLLDDLPEEPVEGGYHATKMELLEVL